MLRSILGELSRIIDLFTVVPGRKYKTTLHERNIYTLISKLSIHNFDIDQYLMSLYTEIESWNESVIQNDYTIGNIKDQNLQSFLLDELGSDTEVTSLLIHDRRLRYQYFTNFDKEPETLTELIASRTKTNITIDSHDHTLSELLTSLIELKRFPILFLFERYNEQSLINKMKTISETLDQLDIKDNIGIYFRLKNDETGIVFNELISNKKYNCILDNNTQVAGIDDARMPKFFLNNTWRPKTVISFDTNIRHNKTAFYINECDLIINYTTYKN